MRQFLQKREPVCDGNSGTFAAVDRLGFFLLGLLDFFSLTVVAFSHNVVWLVTA